MRTLLLLAIAAALARPAGAALAPGDYDRPLAFDAVNRHYLLHVPPSYDGRKTVPLVLDFHGWTSNAIQQRGLSGFLALSDVKGFIVGWPDGLGNAWNAGTCCSTKPTDDVGFIRAVVADIEEAGKIDAARVYITGLSNGGAMSQRMACDAADLFAAAAPLSFPIPLDPISKCDPSRPMPVLTFMGLTDVLVPYNGGHFGSAPGTFDYWHDVDACSGDQPDVSEVMGQSHCDRFTNCAAGVEAGLCSITGQSFGGTFFDGHVLYKNVDNLDLASIAWDFLSRFTLPKKAQASRLATARAKETLFLRDQTARRIAAWTVSIGDGTWSASTPDGLVLTGASIRHGRGTHERRYTLTLTSASTSALLEAIGKRAAAVTGGDVTTPTASSEHLHALVRGRLVVISGSVRFSELGSRTAPRLFNLTLRGHLARRS